MEPQLEPLPTGAASDEAAQLPGAGRGSAETGSPEAGTGGILEVNSVVNTLNPGSGDYLPLSKVEAWLRGDIRLSPEFKAGDFKCWLAGSYFKMTGAPFWN